MEQEEQVKDWQGANGATPAIVFLAMSSFPSVVSIRFFLQLSAYLLILHRIIPPHCMLVRGPPKRSIAEGSRLAHRASRSPEATKSARDA